MVLGTAVPATATAQSTARTTAAQGVAAPVRVVKQALDLPSVSCLTASVCEAVGTGLAPSGDGQVAIAVRIVDGRATRVVRSLNGVTCTSRVTCEAAGQTSVTSTSQGLVVGLLSGKPVLFRVVPGTAALDGLTCQVFTGCEAVGASPTD